MEKSPSATSHVGEMSLVIASHTGEKKLATTIHVGGNKPITASHIEDKKLGIVSHVGGRKPTNASNVVGIDIVEKYKRRKHKTKFSYNICKGDRLNHLFHTIL